MIPYVHIRSAAALISVSLLWLPPATTQESDAPRRPPAGSPAPAAAPIDPEAAVAEDVGTADALWVEFGNYLGRVVDVKEEKVTLALAGLEDSYVEVPIDHLQADARYRIRSARMDQADPQNWLELAEFASEHGLHLRRIEALRKVDELDPSLQQDVANLLDDAREQCTGDRLQQARELWEAGELNMAIQHLEETIAWYDQCNSTQQARELLREIRTDRRGQVERARQVRAEREQVRQENDRLERVRRLMEEGEEGLQTALADYGDYSQSIDALETALRQFERAQQRLGELPQDLGPQARREAEWLETVLRNDLLRTHVELGHLHAAIGDQQTAYTHAGRAASIDPTAPSVEALRLSIAASRATYRRGRR